MKFLKFMAFVATLIVAAVLLWSIGSAFHTGFFQGGLIRTASAFQMLMHSIPYLLGVFLVFGGTYGVFHLLFTKTK